MEPVERARFFTVQEYFAYEASIAGRAEYRNGQIVDMAGGTKGHGQIAANLVGELYNALKGKPCIVYGSDVKIHIEKANAFLYPDLSVACDETELSRLSSLAVMAPTLIVEVLSEGSAIDDLGAKFFTYQQLASLREYILVDQFSPLVNVMHCDENGDWTIKSYSGLESTIEIRSLGLKIPMKDIYDKVAFPLNKRPLITSGL
jgi:Uma2 family endonuclease